MCIQYILNKQTIRRLGHQCSCPIIITGFYCEGLFQLFCFEIKNYLWLIWHKHTHVINRILERGKEWLKSYPKTKLALLWTTLSKEFFQCNGIRWPLFYYLQQQFSVLNSYLCALDTTLRTLNTWYRLQVIDYMCPERDSNLGP